MEMLARLVGRIVIEFIFSFIGWACLYIWYRDNAKVKTVRDIQYAGEFRAAGRVMILNFIAGAGAIVVIGILIYFLLTWLSDSIN